jgi:uracil-DNA glycosylase
MELNMFKQGAISEWMDLVCDERLLFAISDIDRFASKYGILPHPRYVFNMFRMIRPSDVKVVIVGQSPYPGVCPVTHVAYASGVAFLPAFGCVTVPATLRNIILEVSRDICKKPTKSSADILLDWIEQGVMLLNSSLTLGIDCPGYLKDHSMLWEEPMRNVLSVISESYDPVFLLVGKESWKFESSIQKSTDVIKVSHPVARKETSTPWMGSGVFSRISDALIEKEVMPVKWLR